MIFRRNSGVVFIAAASMLILAIIVVFSVRSRNTVKWKSVFVVTPSEISVSESDAVSSQETDENSTSAGMTDGQSTQATTAQTDKSAAETVKKSKSPYVITVYLKSQSVIVYSADENGKAGKTVKRFVCSTGLSGSSTPVGNFTLTNKYRWRALQGNVYGQYCSRIYGNILFHSVPYLKKDPSTLKEAEFDKLGNKASMGCIRLCVRDSKWIYDNAPSGTPVSIVNKSSSSRPAPPKRNTDPIFSGWDPTDQWSEGNPYFSNVSDSTTATGESTDVSESSQTSSSETDETENTQPQPGTGTTPSSVTSAETSPSSSETSPTDGV